MFIPGTGVMLQVLPVLPEIWVVFGIVEIVIINEVIVGILKIDSIQGVIRDRVIPDSTP